MATPKKKTEDVEEQQGPSPAEIELEEMRQHAERLQDRVDTLKSDRAADQDEHIAEVKRHNDIIVGLRGQRNRAVSLTTPEEALNYIISHFEKVALGGSATAMRQAVHDASKELNLAQKNTLRDYALRLRLAAEAAQQETATFLL